MSTLPPTPEPATTDLEVDLAAFLPDGSTLSDEQPDEGEGAELGSDGDRDDGPAPAPPAVDLAALTRIEADLAAVDDALVALDAGDPGRSPLLVELLADERPVT